MHNKKSTNLIRRRKFIALAGTAGAALLVSTPLLSRGTSVFVPQQAVTVGEVIAAFIKQAPAGPIPNTVDTLKSGSADTVVTGIVTCMFPTIAVIKKAAALGANFIIAHEPTFYNHQDDTKWLENDTVFKAKSALLKKHNIAVWRNHDYIHTIQPDGVRKALVEKLGWQKHPVSSSSLYNLSTPLTLKALITELKTKLEIPSLRFIGKLDQRCSKVLLMPGAAGGQRQIEGINAANPDVLVTGEVYEWETAEYIRDAQESGKTVALIVLGHIASEEWGSKYMKSWLDAHFAGIKTTFLRTGASLTII